MLNSIYGMLHPLTIIRLYPSYQKKSCMTSRGALCLAQWLLSGNIPSLGASAARTQAPPAYGTSPLLEDQVDFAAKKLELAECELYVSNIREGLHDLNTSFETYVPFCLGKRARSLLLGQPKLSDTKLMIDDGTCIPAHAAFMAARCPRLTLTPPAEKKENYSVCLNNASYITAIAFLEYIYTDHVSFDGVPRITEGKAVDELELLAVASRLQLPRLVSLCEIHASKKVGDAISESIEHSDINVVHMLNIASDFGALQLEAFLLHFISTNYRPMQKRSEWSAMKTRHKNHCEQHQWPPKNYLQQINQYTKRFGRSAQPVI